jgi:D-aminopeptidase
MASGDQTACGQMAEQLGALETAVTKQASGRFSAECLAPEVTHKMIRESAARAVSRLMKKDAPKPFVVTAPVKMTVQLATSDMADKAMQLPGVTRDGLKLSFVADNMPMAYSVFRVLVTLSYPR